MATKGPNFHDMMDRKYEVKDISDDASQYCAEKFDDTPKIAACRVGVHKVSKALQNRIEHKDPRTVDGYQPDRPSF